MADAARLLLIEGLRKQWRDSDEFFNRTKDLLDEKCQKEIFKAKLEGKSIDEKYVWSRRRDGW